MPFFNCNKLQGASITQLFQACLVVRQTFRDGAIVQMFCSAWGHVRTALRFALWDQWQKGSVYGALSQLLYLWCGGYLKVISWGWRYKSQKGALFIGKAGSHHVILLYYETLLQILRVIYCKRFYWIPLFTTLLLFHMFEIGKVKSATQSVLMILTLNGLFHKNLQAFYFTPANSISLTPRPPPPSVCFFSIVKVFVLNF